MKPEQMNPILNGAIQKMGTKIAMLETDLALAHTQVEIQQAQINSLVTELEKLKEDDNEKEETV